MRKNQKLSQYISALMLVLLTSACSTFNHQAQKLVASNSTPAPELSSEQLKMELFKILPSKTISADGWDSNGMAGILINQAAIKLRAYQQNNTAFKTGLSDLRSMNGWRDYKASNYYLQTGIFTVTYRPMSYYGNNVKTYMPYCPIFYDSQKQEQITHYVLTLYRVQPITVEDLSSYMVLSAFSACALFNKNYQAKKPPPTQEQMLNLSDKFAMAVFARSGKLNAAMFVANHNELLHHNTKLSREELMKFMSKIAQYLDDNDSKNPKGKSLYDLWKQIEKAQH